MNSQELAMGVRVRGWGGRLEMVLQEKGIWGLDRGNLLAHKVRVQLVAGRNQRLGSLMLQSQGGVLPPELMASTTLSLD